ncbi:MAG: protein-glutamate O-methyltransferase CheR [Bdellovibrionota bacterium]|nr:protein-glutamate O-methyltransferase CheR [Bdellovibrionota bacterium]
MSAIDFEKLRDLIYRKTGMRFEAKKDYFLKSRIEQRMAELDLESYGDYMSELLFDRKGKEFQEFLEKITVNETYFFRDFPQLQGFAENVLPSYLEEKRKNGDYNLRIWSAACSTGEEAYTLSIIFNEVIDDIEKWNIEIVATDIDRSVLAKASEGIYSVRSMKETPLPYRAKYFTQNGNEFHVKHRMFENIEFKQLNLTDRIEMLKMRNFDFVFCRNVLIYFDDDSRKKVVAQLYDSLNHSGFLFLGHSESIGRITAAFKLRKIEGFLCYQKP